MSYDLIVIGGGTGGLTAARLVARQGKRVALIERGRPGGDCLWTGCIPTKALAHVAKIMHDARSAARFGVTASDLKLDYQAVKHHVADSQAAAGRLDSPETIASWGVELITGEARFVAPQAIEVEGRTLRAAAFVIATGSRPAIPPIPGLAEAAFDTNETLLEWEVLPRSLAILGGGPIGVEFAQVMRRFGVEVTLLEQLPRLLEREEPEASALVKTVLEQEGVDVATSASVTAVHAEPGGIRIEIEGPAEEHAIVVERLLVATGRRPAVESLNLSAAGVPVSPSGITVDAHLRTSQPHIFAVGDVNGSPQFTHVAEDQGRTVASILKHTPGRFSKTPRWNGRVVPRVTYADPEIAAAGLTEEEARRQRRNVQAWTIPLSEVDRAITMGATDGFLKLVTARGWQSRIPGLAGRVGDEIVGACFVGPNAGDLLMPVVMAMRARLPVGLVAWNMQAYPTMALGVRQLTALPFEE